VKDLEPGFAAQTQALGATTIRGSPDLRLTCNGRPCNTTFTSAPAAAQLSDTSWALKEGTFGGADSILVITDAAGEVIALHFRYALAETFEGQQKSFEEYLGPPTGGHPGPGGALVVFWEDSVTRFELWDPSPRLGGPVRAVMLDRHYYVD
jgi:hypothetical protein